MTVSGLSARAARGYVEHLVKTVVRREPQTIRRRGGGLTNFVYQVDFGDESLILRFHPDPQKLPLFKRERRAMMLAHDIELPVAEVLHIGADPHPFMLMRNVRGTVGTHVRDRLGTLRQMGEITSRIHRIRMRSYGRASLDEAPSRAARHQSWGAHLENDVQASRRITQLEQLGMLLPDNAKKMRRTLSHMCTWRRNPVLHHGDMRLKNVIVNHAAKIVAVIDWENCISSVPALWDLSIALHDLSIDEKQAFLQGYGYGARELTKSIPYLRLFNALNYAPFIVAAAQRGEKAALGWHRARMAGDFNLYP